MWDKTTCDLCQWLAHAEQQIALTSLERSIAATCDLVEAVRGSPWLLQVILAGLQEGDTYHAVAQLHQAAAVAARYSLSTWGLSMHFVEALLSMPVSLEGSDEALKVCTGVSLPSPLHL